MKDEAVSLFKTITPKQTMYGKGKKLSKQKTQNIKNLFKWKIKKDIKYGINRNVWTPFKTEEERKEMNELEEQLIID